MALYRPNKHRLYTFSSMPTTHRLLPPLPLLFIPVCALRYGDTKGTRTAGCAIVLGCQGYRIHITGTVPPFNLSLPPYFCSVEQILVPAKRASVTIQGQKIGKSMTASVKSSRPSGRISRSKTMMMMCMCFFWEPVTRIHVSFAM